MKFADVTPTKISVAPNVSLNVWDAGPKDAQTLLFIPGLTFSGAVFCHQLDHFSDRYRVVLVDPRGQGDSTTCSEGNNYMAHGVDLIELCRQLSIHKPVLVGWSCGNLEAWSFVRQAGWDAVAGLVTVDMSPLPLNSDPSAWTEGTPDELRAVGTQVLTNDEAAAGFWDEYLREVMWQGPLTQAQYDYFMGLGAGCTRATCHELFCDAILSDYRPEAQDADKNLPTLMYVAEHWADVAVPWFNTLCPNTPTEVLGAHLMANQYPQQFNARLEQFLQEANL